MKKILRHILPPFFIAFYKSYKKQHRASKRQLLRERNQITHEQDIIFCLQKQGVKEGDVLMVHSSLSKMGYVEGGPDTVINALMKTVGRTGTLMMPSFPGVGFSYDYLKTNPIFDVRNTVSKMGIVTELFRNRKDVKRSLHPTDPVCALGPQADYLTEDHFGQITPYNSFSPFYRLCELRGKILLLGVDLNSLTNLHTSEDAIENFKYPVYHSHLFTCKLINEKGIAVEMQTKVHNPVYSKKRQCNSLIPLFNKAGFLKQFKLGSANCMLIDAQHMHVWMVKNYIEHGISMYTPNGD